MSELPERLRQFYAEATLPVEALERLVTAGRRAHRQRMILWGSLAAAAAAMVLLCFAPIGRSPKLTAESVDEQVSGFFAHPDARLDFASADPRAVRTWLEAHHGPSDFKIPPGLLGKATVGCEILGADDRRVFIICFLDSPGRIASADTVKSAPPTIVHLVLASKKAFAALPPSIAQPRFATHRGWTLATWTDGEHVYLLTTDAGFEPLRRALKA